MQTELGKELQALLEELRHAARRAEQLADSVDEAQWGRRPASGGWSPAECIVHLNLTTDQFLPLIREQVRRHYGQALVDLLEQEDYSSLALQAPSPQEPSTFESRHFS